MGQLLWIYTRSSLKQGSFLQEARIAKAILFWCLFSWCFRALMLQFLQSQHQPSSPPNTLPTPCCQPRSSSLLPTSVPSSCFRSSHLPPAQIPSDTSASCCAPDCAASSAFLIPSLFPRIFQSFCFHSLSQPKGILVLGAVQHWTVVLSGLCKMLISAANSLGRISVCSPPDFFLPAYCLLSIFACFLSIKNYWNVSFCITGMSFGQHSD